MPELQDIPSNFTIGDYITVTAGNDAACLTNQGEGKLRFLCDPSHLAWDDPIVFPNQTGAAHLHHFFGNTLTDASSTYTSLRTTGDGTCAGGPLNRTGYWYPAVIKPAGPGFATAKVVKPAFIEMYYTTAAADTLSDFTRLDSNPLIAPVTHALQGFPRGFQMVWGWKHADEETPYGVWGREDATGATGAASGLVGGRYGTFADLATNMPSSSSSDNLFARIDSPGCWDGVNLTLGGGRTHVAFEVQDGNGHLVCPATHPWRIPVLTVIASFSHNGPSDFSTWFLSSDKVDYGGDDDQIGGTTFHTDWFGAWDTTVSDIWETIHLQVGGVSTSQKTANSGLLCTGNKQLINTGKTYDTLPTNGFGGLHLDEANRYLDIPVRRRWARLPPAMQFRVHS
jgi:hypothetical protein